MSQVLRHRFNFILSEKTLQIEIRVPLTAGILEDSPKVKRQSNHESTKSGKHEKGPGFLYHPLFFCAFACPVVDPELGQREPRRRVLSCLRDKGFFCLSVLLIRPFSSLPTAYCLLPTCSWDAPCHTLPSACRGSRGCTSESLRDSYGPGVPERTGGQRPRPADGSQRCGAAHEG